MKHKKVTSVLIFILILSMLLSACGSPAGTETAEPEKVQSDSLSSYDFPDFEPVWGTMHFPGEYNKESEVEVEYAYSDRYFDIDSTIYNPSLATMSLCLELSAWASYETDVWEEKTQNAKKLLDEIGFQGFAQSEAWQDKPTTESIGVVAAHKELEDCTLIALPIRGGKYYNEWGGNVNLGLEGEHEGFAEARDEVIRFLETYIADQGITGRVKIWVVGYSRGGAVANLTAGYLNTHGLSNGAELAFEDLYCYAFEPPQGALADLVGDDLNHANIHNIVNPNDIVPMVAPGNWDFTRYNSTSRLLPTVTTVGFASARETMLEEYAEILEGVELKDPAATAYNISEYAKTLQVSVTPLQFLSSGEPLLTIEVVDDTRQTMNEVLTNFITCFSGSIDGRGEFYSSLQTDLIYLLDQLMGYETGLDLNSFVDQVMEVMTANDYENLKYVLSPVLQLGDASVDARIDQVAQRLHEVLPQPEGFTDLYGTAGTLVQAAGTMLVHHPGELLDVILAFTNSKLMQAHYEEITLAWVRAGDPHYTDTPYTMAVPETLRILRVNCPVDVRVYDSQNREVAGVIGDVCRINDTAVGCAINEDGEIILHLPSDEVYRVESTATDDGTVNITLSEYNVVHSQVTRVQNYTDIPVTSGEILALAVPNLTEEEFTDESRQGSTAEYRLLNGSGEVVPCQRETRGGEVAYFAVTAAANNACGVVTGGGQYLDGTFAQVTAQPIAGSSFEGWYENGTLVSTAPAYRFPVEADVALTAHFTEAELYTLRFSVSGKGTVHNVSQSYSAGSRVQLSAEAGAGYGFDHWETTSGTLENADSPQAVLVVDRQDAAVTAVFRRTACPSCGQSLSDGQNHGTACGHYSCDGNAHYKQACGHYACGGGEHEKLPCGHYACESGDHSTICTVSGCGKYLCDGHTHTDLCGKCNQPGAHQMDCGHYSCDSAVSAMNHEMMSCGHYGCAGGEHAPAACGTDKHYVCDGDDHGAGDCGSDGHYACDGTDHETAPCGTDGHFNCSGDHGAAACGFNGHFVCDSEDHTALYDEYEWRTCGHYKCDASVAKLDHTMRPEGCMHFYCDLTVASLDHTYCLNCGTSICLNEIPAGVFHGTGAGSCKEWWMFGCKRCNEILDDPEQHMLGCRIHYSCDASADGLDHSAMDCGIHYHCDSSAESLDHSICQHCGGGLCNEYTDHESLMECGCNECTRYIRDHDVPECGTTGHYACDGRDHTVCGLCGLYKCGDGTGHGEGICDTGASE